MYKRPEVTSNERFGAAGLAFEVIEPFEHLTVEYEGKVVVLDDPLEMADPRQAFTENPYETCTASLVYRRVSDMFGGEPEEQHERPGEEFAKGHYEQLVSATGTITVGDTTSRSTGTACATTPAFPATAGRGTTGGSAANFGSSSAS
jgi:hypothetical protein